MSNYTMTIFRRDYRTVYEYRQAIKFWLNCGRTVRLVPGGVEIVGDQFGVATEDDPPYWGAGGNPQLGRRP